MAPATTKKSKPISIQKKAGTGAETEGEAILLLRPRRLKRRNADASPRRNDPSPSAPRRLKRRNRRRNRRRSDPSPSVPRRLKRRNRRRSQGEAILLLRAKKAAAARAPEPVKASRSFSFGGAKKAAAPKPVEKKPRAKRSLSFGGAKKAAESKPAKAPRPKPVVAKKARCADQEGTGVD